jgi:hypothetical protein
MSEQKQMNPMSGEHVEIDGVYKNEWGREEEMARGDVFPADPILGDTEWQLIEYNFENHHDGRTDPRLVPQKDSEEQELGKITHPRRRLR